MDKEEQKKLLIEIIEADEKDGLYKTNNMAQQTYGEWMRSNPPIPNLTAVEWYADELLGLMLELATNTITESEYHTKRSKAKEQAKQMEKEQITNAHIEGQRVFDKHPHTQWTNDQAEQYYNETYGKPNLEENA